MMNKTHNFEVPLFVEPTSTFKRLIMHPDVLVKCIEEKLLFILEKNKTPLYSIKLFPNNFPESRKTNFKNDIAIFASKLNYSKSITNNVSITIDTTSNEEKSIYGKDTIAIIKVSVTSYNKTIETQLIDFFKVVDKDI